jgi:hypothetical protein
VQGCSSQRRGVALGAEDDDLQVSAGLRQARGAGRVEAPLEHVALDDQRAGNLTLLHPLRVRPDVDQQRAGGRSGVGLLRRVALQPCMGGGEQGVDAHDSSGESVSTVRTRCRPAGEVS